MPVRDATLSPSPGNPQLHKGVGCPSASSPSIGTWMCPNSPAIPAAPRTTLPLSITPPPGPIDEIHRASQRDNPVRAGRPRRVQAHRAHRFTRNPRQAEHARERLGERLDGHPRTLSNPAGCLDKSVHQEPSRGIEHSRVDGPPAIVEAHNDLPALTWHPAPPLASPSELAGLPGDGAVPMAAEH